VQHFLLKKRDDLIGLREKKLYSENEDDIDPVEKVESVQPSAEENMNKVFLVEAIRRIPNPDQKLVILKELQGYSHREIADILNSVRRREGRVKRNALGEEILADGAAVDVLKQRAMEFLKKELGHLKK
jgi:DNA-directed RNA polymerase specialized sigma24 family protein